MTCNPGMAVELPGSNVACATLTVRECLTVNGVDITGGGGGGGGWTDDGAVVRLTTAADQVAVGAALPVGVSPLSVYEAASKWFAVGAVDPFGRRGLWFTMTSSVLRMGANTADGDAFDATSEGAVVWDPAGNKSARIKADRFGLTRAADTSLYYFRVDGSSLFYRADPPGGLVWLNIDRATGSLVASNQTASRMESLEAGAGFGGGRVRTKSDGDGARLEALDNSNAVVGSVMTGSVGPGEGQINLLALGATGTSLHFMDAGGHNLNAQDPGVTSSTVQVAYDGSIVISSAADPGTGFALATQLSVTKGPANTGEIQIGMVGNPLQTIGFFGAAPVVQPAAVPVNVAAIHAALVALGLIT